MIVRAYRALFARRLFFKLNKLLYNLSLSGMGVLNFENDRVSGESRFLRSLLKGKTRCVVLDVGANVGDYSRKIFQVCPQATVYAFEPHPKTYSILSRSIPQSGFIAVNAAAGDKEGEVSLFDYEEKDGSSHASLYRNVIEKIHKAKSVEHKVTVIELGAFASSRSLEKIDLLKIDTEGNELSVLKGMLDYIRGGRIGAIHFEFNEMNVASRTFFRDFWDFLPNYDFYRMLPDGLVRIESYSPIYCEIFAYQNVVAILKRA